MNNNITPDTLIQYLDNELDPDYRLYVESQVASDPELGQLLERLRLAREAFVQYARKEAVGRVHRQAMQEKKQTSGKVVKMDWMRTTLRVAVVVLVLVLIAGIVQYNLLDRDRLYANHYSQYTLSIPRGDSSISEAERAYRTHNMQQVISLYESRVQPQEHFLAGQAYLAVNEPQKAVAAFDAQLNANAALQFKPYQDDAEYYLALAYLKSGNTEKALPIFERIHRTEAHAYNEEVSGWFLTQLRWLKAKQSN